MFCQKEMIGKEIYGIYYISAICSVFFLQSTELSRKHSCMCSGLTMARHPLSSSPAPHPQQVRGENMIKKLMGQDKIIYHLPSQAKHTQLGEC